MHRLQEFGFYSREMNCLEINASHYRFFEPSTWDKWRQQAAAVRPSFTYVVKVCASRVALFPCFHAGTPVLE